MCLATYREGGGLMYSNILNVKFSEIREKFKKFDSLDVGKRIITLTNMKELDTVSDDSDVIVYYNVMGDTTPVMLIERIKMSSIKEKQLRKDIETFNKESGEYIANIIRVKKESKQAEDYLDILVVRERVYENLKNN